MRARAVQPPVPVDGLSITAASGTVGGLDDEPGRSLEESWSVHVSKNGAAMRLRLRLRVG
jgi:hypothetical protein